MRRGARCAGLGVLFPCPRACWPYAELPAARTCWLPTPGSPTLGNAGRGAGAACGGPTRALLAVPVSSKHLQPAWYPPLAMQEEMRTGEAGRLYQVMAAMARPMRLTRGKQIDAAWTVDEVSRCNLNSSVAGTAACKPLFGFGRAGRWGRKVPG